MSLPNRSNRPETPPLARGQAWRQGRRAEFLEAADRVILREGPSASMDGIAAEAGISRMVLYRNFGDKGGLYRALAERYVTSLMDRLRAALLSTDDPQARLEATIDAYVGFIEENKEAYDFLMHRAIREGREAEETVADFMRTVAHEIGNVLKREISALGFDPDPAEAWAHGVVGMVHLSTDWWLRSGDVSRERFIRYLVGLLSRGFFGLVEDGEWPGGEPFDVSPAAPVGN